MKTKSLIQVLFILLLLFMLSYSVFAIQGSDSSGSITSYSGTTGAAAASGSSSDNTVSGGRVSAGGSAISSGYTDGTISGNPGADLSTTDESTSSESDTGSSTNAESESSLNSIPSGSGGGGGGSRVSEEEASATEEATTEVIPQEVTETVTEAATETQEAAVLTKNAVTIAIELTEGSSVTLAPQIGAARMSILSVTATSATIVITSDGTNSITGGVIYSTDQEITLEVGEIIDVDSDGDDSADLQVTLSQIDYNAEKRKYEGIFTLTYLSPSEEVVSFVKEQVERGEVAFVNGPAIQEISFVYWVWIIVALIVVGVLTLIGWVLFNKINKKH